MIFVSMYDYLFSKEQGVEECDATMFNDCVKVGHTKFILVQNSTEK